MKRIISALQSKRPASLPLRPLLFVLLLIAQFDGLAQKTEYHVDKSARNSVKFISDAPVEDFEGVTEAIDGYLVHEGNDFTSGSGLYFEVDLRKLDTGIGLRNRHMRENYLHTDKYPYAKFTGKITEATPSGDKTKVKVQGSMDIHGVKRGMEVTGTISGSGDKLRIRTTFDVRLTHHKIEVPQLMFVKIDENMELVLDFTVKKVK